jgi:hypothetical protein
MANRPNPWDYQNQNMNEEHAKRIIELLESIDDRLGDIESRLTGSGELSEDSAWARLNAIDDSLKELVNRG